MTLDELILALQGKQVLIKVEGRDLEQIFVATKVYSRQYQGKSETFIDIL